MGRISKNELWLIKVYNDRKREGNEFDEYICKTLKEVLQKTGLRRSTIHAIRTGVIKNTKYVVKIINKNIFEPMPHSYPTAESFYRYLPLEC